MQQPYSTLEFSSTSTPAASEGRCRMPSTDRAVGKYISSDALTLLIALHSSLPPRYLPGSAVTAAP